MKISYIERLKSIEKIDKYIELYHIPCVESCIDFINRFVMTFDPRKQEQIIPFELFAKQEGFIKWLWDRLQKKDNGVVDKARDVGATWTVIAVAYYLFYFLKKSTYLYSYKADAVDLQKRSDTLFGKLSIIYNYLPLKMKMGVKVSHMLIVSNDAEIAGLSGEEPRGGRSYWLIKDESAFYDHPEKVEAALGEYADCIIDISTHNGTNSLFYNKVTSGVLSVFIINWFDNPNHTQELYNKKKEEAIAKGMLADFEREINRNPYASVGNIVIPYEYVLSVRKCGYIKNGIRRAGLDIADSGEDTNSLCVMDGNELFYLEEWGNLDPVETAKKAFWKCVELEVETLNYDCIGLGAGTKGIIRDLQEPFNEKKIELEDKLKQEDIKDKKKLEKELTRINIILDMKIKGFNAGSKVVDPDEVTYSDKTNKELFENIKAQVCFKLRVMFLNTHKYLNKEDYEEDKIISFKNFSDNILFNKFAKEISQPQHKLSLSGKIVIDKKPKGTKSPNLFDSFQICMADIEEEWLSWDFL